MFVNEYYNIKLKLFASVERSLTVGNRSTVITASVGNDDNGVVHEDKLMIVNVNNKTGTKWL